jgi:excisionase family DNA binding protein
LYKNKHEYSIEIHICNICEISLSSSIADWYKTYDETTAARERWAQALVWRIFGPKIERRIKMIKLLTLEEAAEVLGVDYKTVYRLVRSGNLVAGKIGRVYRISPDDLKAYFESTKPQKPVALQGLRCCITGKQIVSELDIGGRDPETGEPICVEAWEAMRKTTTPKKQPSEETRGEI